AARKLWRTQAHAAVSLGAETEPVAVQVIAVGDREMHFNRRCVQRAGVKAERLFGLEQVVSIASQLQLRRCRRAKQQYDKRREKSVHVLVSADRKSTRLNSSHVEISYAVFCLKKKI